MATFDYEAIDIRGKKRSGVLDGDSPRQVRQKLKQLGLVPLAVTSNLQKHSLPRYRDRLAPATLAIITRQLAVLLRAGIPLSDALNGIAKQTSSLARGSPSSRIIAIVRSSVEEGKSLSQSLEQFPRSFDQLYCATVKAGEETGHLDSVLEQLAEHAEAQREFRQKTQAALVYPILLVLLSIVIVSALMVYIVPDVIQVFTDTGQKLPVLTRGLLQVSDFLQNWGVALLLLIAVFLGAGSIAMRQPKIRQKLHQALLHMPLIKTFSRGINSQRYTQTLGVLSQSGVTLHQGMQIAQQVVKNLYMRGLLQEVADRVREGESLSRGLENMGYFPPLMVYMIASGEVSGELDQMLLKAADQQLQDIKTTVATGVSLFEPLMLLVMGGVVLTIVLAILLPILNMNQLIG
jgi:general secretion pathway protein F